MDVTRMLSGNGAGGPSVDNAYASVHSRHSPYAQAVQVLSMDLPSSNLPPKHVCFEYLLAETSQQRARLPLRVNIFPHDGTDSIIATVKNFFGLYDGHGVSFEDKSGNTLIARYENFENNMAVHVRVADEVVPTPEANSPHRPRLAPAFELAANPDPISRPSSRAAKKRSVSPPTAPGNRSISVGTARSRARKSRGEDGDSDSDVGAASVTSSRRGKIDIVASAEISVENIVEGSRRKRSRFDSSELPLFVPTQVAMPASVSSVSPQRKVGPSAASPFQYNQHTFYYNPVPSPQSLGTESSFKPPTGPSQASRHYMRNSIGHMNGILPTPDPTICSVISDEDVALQLMRLGDASNYSTHGRTSTSTLDDALSGKADASSCDETEDGSDVDGPGTYASYSSGSDDGQEALAPVNAQGHYPTTEGDQFRPAKKPRISNGSRASTAKPRKIKVKPGQVRTLGANSLAISAFTGKPFLASQPLQQLPPLGPDEEDLSSKPRCQRCRKSKKGCDRQRPCGRCRDAGIGADGCVSEDEGNGRKGRYGRHMGVSVKKATVGDAAPAAFAAPALPLSINVSAPAMSALPAPVRSPLKLDVPRAQAYAPMAAVMSTLGDMAPPPAVGFDGLGKKRKR